MVGNFQLTLVALALVTMCGCSRRPYYGWGSYESSIFAMYATPESYILDDDLERLASEIEITTPKNLIPPGKAAHLGLLYSLKGDLTNAKRYFNLEKELYPESLVLMNRLITKSK